MASPAAASSRTRSAGVRRLLQEAAELEADDCPDYQAGPLEDDLFQWHFTIRGPGAEFEGGVYHGRMILPSEYPFKPPEIYMATPSGRFETNKKICLSISSFHPETWQPSWGIRTALLALMAFFTTEAGGAVGSLDTPAAERRRLAKASQAFLCSTCGFDARTFPPALDTTPRPATPSAEPRADSDTSASSPPSVATEPPSIVLSAQSTPALVVEATEAEAEPPVASPALPPLSISLPPPDHSPIFPNARGSTAGEPQRAPPQHQHHQVAPRSPPAADGGVGDAGRPVGGHGGHAGGPQLPLVHHRHPAPVVLPPQPAAASIAQAGMGAVIGGGPPLWIDRAILVCLLALMAAVVRKLA